MTTSVQPSEATKPASGAGEMCRLTICGPHSRIEIAVPVHIPIADLMPTLLGHLDPALATSGLGHDGWVLQRLGEPPLDEDMGTSTLGLFDGDVLHLRPRDDQIPMVAFDDIVDGVHTGLSARSDRWRPQLTRRLLLILSGAAATAAVLLVLTAGSGLQVAVCAGVLAVALLAAAAAAVRALGDRTAGLMLAYTGLGFAAAAGLAVPALDRAPLAAPGVFTAPGVLAAGACLAVAAGLARLAVGVDSLFTALGGATAFGGLAALVPVLTDTPSAGVAAGALSLALIVTRFVPVWSARSAGITVEPVPRTHAEFQQNIDPQPSDVVLAKAERADRYLTATLRALGIVCAVSLVVVAGTPGWMTATLAGCGAAVLALQSRELAATAHRLAALVPAVLSVPALIIALATSYGPVVRLGVTVGCVLLAGVLLATAKSLPTARLVPRWGRWGDLLHWLTALAVVPLALGVLGVYGWVRELMA